MSDNLCACGAKLKREQSKQAGACIRCRTGWTTPDPSRCPYCAGPGPGNIGVCNECRTTTGAAT